MKSTIALGLLSEILLFVGIILVVFDVWTNQVFVGCGFGVTTCGYFFQLIWPIFYLAIALILASAIGFLLFLNRARKATTAQNGAPN